MYKEEKRNELESSMLVEEKKKKALSKLFEKNIQAYKIMHLIKDKTINFESRFSKTLMHRQDSQYAKHSQEITFQESPSKKDRDLSASS